jgi:hypothetical protein
MSKSSIIHIILKPAVRVCSIVSTVAESTSTCLFAQQ